MLETIVQVYRQALEGVSTLRSHRTLVSSECTVWAKPKSAPASVHASLHSFLFGAQRENPCKRVYIQNRAVEFI